VRRCLRGHAPGPPHGASAGEQQQVRSQRRANAVGVIRRAPAVIRRASGEASRKQTRADARAHAHVSAPRVRRAMFGLRMQEAEPVNREQVNPEP